MSVDATKLSNKVNEIAQANPDFVYEQPKDTRWCLYTHKDGKPGCIVGRGMAELGEPIDYNDIANNGKDVDDLYRLGYITGDLRDVQWLQNVQIHQDVKHSWGTAVALANVAEAEE